MMDYYNNYKSIYGTYRGGNYPSIFVIDDYGSTMDRSVSNTLTVGRNSHGEKTLLTIKSIAKRLFNSKIYKSNYFRPLDNNYPTRSIMDALFSVLLFEDLKLGDILIANIETGFHDGNSHDENSIVTEVFCREMLRNLIELGVIVIVPAGNKTAPIDNADLAQIGDIIVVGSFNYNSTTSRFETKNRYNNALTCFAEDEIPIGVGFTDTSAATAQIAGFVMQIQKYAKSKGSFLTPTEVKTILNTIGDKINITPTGSRTTLNDCNIPTWDLVSREINELIPRRI